MLNGTSPIRDYVDPQWQFVGNAGWTKGSHNVKFGFDYILLKQDHYETQVQDFTFNGGVTTLPGGTAANDFNRFASFLLGMPSSRTAQVMTPLLGGDASGASPSEQHVPAEYAPELQHRHLHPRSVEPDAEDHGVGGPPVGVLRRCRPARTTASRCTTSTPTGC